MIGPSVGFCSICCWLADDDDDWLEIDDCCCNWATVAWIAWPMSDVLRRGIDPDFWFSGECVEPFTEGVDRRNAFEKLSNIL